MESSSAFAQTSAASSAGASLAANVEASCPQEPVLVQVADPPSGVALLYGVDRADAICYVGDVSFTTSLFELQKAQFAEIGTATGGDVTILAGIAAPPITSVTATYATGPGQTVSVSQRHFLVVWHGDRAPVLLVGGDPSGSPVAQFVP
jgi:hypothetical protein